MPNHIVRDDCGLPIDLTKLPDSLLVTLISEYHCSIRELTEDHIAFCAEFDRRRSLDIAPTHVTSGRNLLTV